MTALAVVVPTLNEEGYIERCVTRLLAQMPADSRLYVADGRSTDRTAELVNAMTARDSRVVLVDNPGRNQASACNIVADLVKGQTRVLVRADAHSDYPENFIETVMRAYEQQQRPASVVVRMDTKGQTCFQKAAAAAQNSRLGNGGSPHRIADPKAGAIDHGKHALFDLEFFERVGGYDVNFRANEDAELDLRIVKAGGQIWMCPDAPVFYFPRRTPFALAKQYFYYGVGRFQSCDKHNVRPKPRQLLPVVATAGNMLAVGLATAFPAALLVPALYLAACTAWGVALAVRDRDFCVLASGAAAAIMHMAWGTGYLWAWLRRLAEGAPSRDVGVAGAK